MEVMFNLICSWLGALKGDAKMMNETFHENLTGDIPGAGKNGAIGMNEVDEKLTSTDYKIGSLIAVIVLTVFVIGIRFI